MKPQLVLYREIRRLHRQLPPELMSLGNNYVKEEFRRHAKASPEFIPTFMKEWIHYKHSLEQQVSQKKIGKKLDAQVLDQLSPDQLEQLYELHQAAYKK